MDSKKESLIYFNSITNILILLILFFGSLTYADSNGVWQYASDTRSGTFGSDESGFNSNYTFVNPVYFYTNTVATGVSTFNDLRSTSFNSNSANINGNLNVTGNLILDNTLNCNSNQKLSTNASGEVTCITDDDVPENGDFGAAIDLDSTGAVTAKYAGSTTVGGAATDLSCTNCVSETEIADGLDTTEIDETVIQQRVTGTCVAGSSIRVISQDGGVTCETDNTGISSETQNIDNVLAQGNDAGGRYINNLGGIDIKPGINRGWSGLTVLKSTGGYGGSGTGIYSNVLLYRGIGVLGYSAGSQGIGVKGLSSGYGYLKSCGFFCKRYMPSIGVLGDGQVNGYGVRGISVNQVGVEGTSTKGIGVKGVSRDSWAGVFTGGQGVYVSSCTGCSVLAEMIRVSSTPINGEILCTNPNNGDVEACLEDKSSRVKGIAQVNAEMVLRRGCSKTLEKNGSNGMSLGGISPKNILEQPECKGWYPVALSGLSEKTFVVCSSPNGKKLAYGDILVSSNVSGYLRPLDIDEDALSYQVVGRADSICSKGLERDKIDVWIN